MNFRNAQVMDGQGWNKALGISDAAAADLACVTRLEADTNSRIVAWYKGSSITISDYNGFPTGSVIFDIGSSTKKVYCKSAATTWVGATLS